ncbi:glycine betaine ABC transporter substrate-binding protein [Pseudochelatococcus contaminans]|uniref:Glycine betaine/proline transport system substrate-binding protein n=1 Tax=Pseudochelatococcus contaminans TaxID=1538103 RepID=A0A7W5Z259_9HYPH|nr:glycine betaine ABC transporter substrate-binding protein [Pseudochelatococcus contaminans]MBB3808604.1 glycine betaine/proline transport system substrate-binding protein [Pseudochelatococcus contaminans]
MFKTLVSMGLAAVLLGSVPSSAMAQDTKPVKLGWSAWADGEFVTKLAAKLIQDNYDQKVELIQVDIAPLYQGVSRGDVDAMMMAWLPQTHADYFARVKDKVDTLGTVYDGAKLGWAVPAYIPEDAISSIEDLKKDDVREKLKGRIEGIDPGAGLTRLSEAAVKDYDLNRYRLQISSEAGMLTTIDRAIRSDDWFVATLWSPHWAFGKYELRYLDDPKNALGEAEHVDILARKGFKEDNPKVAEFLSRMKLPIEDLQNGMYEAQNTSYDQAIQSYIEKHPDQIKAWLGTAQ